MKDFVFSLFFPVCVLCLFANADALMVGVSLQELVKSSDTIAVVTVQKKESQPVKEGLTVFPYGGKGSVFTCVELSVDRSIKNPSLKSHITVLSWGGRLASGQGMWVEDEAGFQEGEKALVFLSKNPDYASSEFCSRDGYHVNANMQGKYTIENGMIANIMVFEDKPQPLSLEDAITDIERFLK